MLRKPVATSPSRPRTGKPWSNFTGRRSQPGDRITGHRGYARTITKTTMGRLSLIPMATTSKRFATASKCNPDAASARRPAKHGFHRPPRLDRFVVSVDLDIAPAHHRAMGDIVLQFHAMREADRQCAGRQ